VKYLPRGGSHSKSLIDMSIWSACKTTSFPALPLHPPQRQLTLPQRQPSAKNKTPQSPAVFRWIAMSLSRIWKQLGSRTGNAAIDTIHVSCIGQYRIKIRYWYLYFWKNDRYNTLYFCQGLNTIHITGNWCIETVNTILPNTNTCIECINIHRCSRGAPLEP
jgi:hypothetical protein